MTKSISRTTYAAAIGLGLLSVAGLTARAQGTHNATVGNAPAADTTSTNGAPTGTLEKYHGMLRASELTGANVYNDQGTEIGTVNDLLMGDDGKVQNAVLSVGGFLGVGTHYVSVAFGQLQVQPSASGTANGTVGNGASGSGHTVTPTERMAGHGGGYYSVVLPGATKDTLTKMPAFNYRS